MAFDALLSNPRGTVACWDYHWAADPHYFPYIHWVCPLCYVILCPGGLLKSLPQKMTG